MAMLGYDSRCNNDELASHLSGSVTRCDESLGESRLVRSSFR